METKAMELKASLIKVVLEDFFSEKLFEQVGDDVSWGNELSAKLKENLAFKTELNNYKIVDNRMMTGSILHEKEDGQKYSLDFTACATGIIVDDDGFSS